MPDRRVSYFYNPDVGNFYFGPGHPHKPHIVRMVHNLLHNYGVLDHMEIVRPHYASDNELTRFHADDYIQFMKHVTPETAQEHQAALQRFNVNFDNPIFDGLYEFNQISAGGSIAGAVKLNQQQADICINWAGGRHHAKKSEASGFCYVNDIVLSILELLKYHQRVLYIDIDIHHGDGVEEAFYCTDRVMTCSFHKFGDYFPGTGHLLDVGYGKGKNTAVNFPLNDGLDDDSFLENFKPIITAIMERYRPGAVVLQCGADSLSGDRLGSFNLSLRGHAEAARFVRSFNVPTLMLGGGGYTMRNVSRCWTNETAIALGIDLPDQLPYNDYYYFYGPTYTLHVPASNMENLNGKEYLEKCRIKLLEQLRNIEPAPSVAFHDVPPDSLRFENDDDRRDPDVRISQRDKDRHVRREGELDGSDVEDNQGADGPRPKKGGSTAADTDSDEEDEDSIDAFHRKRRAAAAAANPNAPVPAPAGGAPGPSEAVTIPGAAPVRPPMAPAPGAAPGMQPPPLKPQPGAPPMPPMMPMPPAMAPRAGASPRGRRCSRRACRPGGRRPPQRRPPQDEHDHQPADRRRARPGPARPRPARPGPAPIAISRSPAAAPAAPAPSSRLARLPARPRGPVAPLPPRPPVPQVPIPAPAQPAMPLPGAVPGPARPCRPPRRPRPRRPAPAPAAAPAPAPAPAEPSPMDTTPQ
eukprot:tig00000215_g18663.t1